MGANESGVVGGNEAIHTVLSDELISADGSPTKSLLGMDLLRLALERGTSAKQAMEVCTALLEEYGQGGPCCQTDTNWTYENSFLFADADEAYVLETAGRKHWAWERVEPGGYRNISNGVSIRSNWGAVSKDIRSICKENGWWDGSSDFGKCIPTAFCNRLLSTPTGMYLQTGSAQWELAGQWSDRNPVAEGKPLGLHISKK